MIGIGLRIFTVYAGRAVLCLCMVATAGAASWEKETESGQFSVRIAPESGAIEIGKLQYWQLTLHDANGAAVRDAHIDVGGGMRAHGHGLPTQPLVTEQMRAGHYRIEGVRLNMRGQWTLAFSIRISDASDRVLFDIDAQSDNNALRAYLASLAVTDELSPPVSKSNRVADSKVAAMLGERLFFDPQFSANGEISCATCHQPERYFADGRKLGQGIGGAMRNTPSVVGAAYQSWFYWDGRRDSLWSQALVPFEAPDEMGGSRLAVVRRVAEDAGYRELYTSVFGALPQGLRLADWPKDAGPYGDAASREAWFRLDSASRDKIDTVFANLGKAIAAYERTIPVPLTRFDAFAQVYLAGDKDAFELLSDDERAGLRLFLDDSKTACMRCHNGPMFTNNGFNNIGTGTFSGATLDFGRVYGLQSAIRDVFNCIGPHSDQERDDCEEWRFLNRNSHVPLEGAFKVPTLRGLAHTAPYMHDGRFATLEEVIDYYRAPPGDGPPHELQPLTLSDAESRQLLAFLRTLSDKHRSAQQTSGGQIRQ